MKESLVTIGLLSVLCSGSVFAAPPILIDGLPNDVQYNYVNTGPAPRSQIVADQGNTWITFSNGGNISEVDAVQGINAGSNHIKMSMGSWTGDTVKVNVLRTNAGTPNMTNGPSTINIDKPLTAASTWFAHGRIRLPENGAGNLDNAGHIYISGSGHFQPATTGGHTISNPITLGTTNYSEGHGVWDGANIRIQESTLFTGIMTVATPSKLAGAGKNYTIDHLSGASTLSLASGGYHIVTIKDGAGYTGTLSGGTNLRIALGDGANAVSFEGTIITKGGHFIPAGTGTKTVKNLTITDTGMGNGAEGTLIISNKLSVTQSSTHNAPITFGHGMTYVAPASGAFTANGITLPVRGSITIDTSRLTDIPIDEERIVLTTSTGAFDETTEIKATPGFSASIVGTSIVVRKTIDAAFTLEADTEWSSLAWVDDATKTAMLTIPDTVNALTLTLNEPILAKTLSIRTSANTILTINTTDGYIGNALTSIDALLAQGRVIINGDLRTTALIAGVDLQINANQATTALTIPLGASATILPTSTIPTITKNDGTLYLKGVRDSINADANPFFATCGLVVFDDDGTKRFDFGNRTGITTRLRFDGTGLANPNFSFRSALDGNAFNVTDHGPDKPTIEVINTKVTSITRSIFGYNPTTTNATIKLSGTLAEPAEIEFAPIYLDPTTAYADRFTGQFILNGTTRISSVNPSFAFIGNGGDARPSIVVEAGGSAELITTAPGKIVIYEFALPTFEVKEGGTLTLSSELSVNPNYENVAFRKTGAGTMIMKKPSHGINPYSIAAGTLILQDEGAFMGEVAIAPGATLEMKSVTATGTAPLRKGASGMGTIITSGTGKVILDQPSPNFTGSITLNEGTLEATVPNALGSAKISLAANTTLTMWKDTSDLARIKDIASGAIIKANAPTNLLSEVTWIEGSSFTLTFALTNDQLAKTDPITILLKDAPLIPAENILVMNSNTGVELFESSSYLIEITKDAITITPVLSGITLTYSPESKGTNAFVWQQNSPFDNGTYNYLDDVIFKDAVRLPTTVTVGDDVSPKVLTLDAGYTFEGEPFSVVNELIMVGTSTDPLASTTINQTITTPILNVSNGRLNLGTIRTSAVKLGENATLKADTLNVTPQTLIKAVRFVPLKTAPGGDGWPSVAEIILYRRDVPIAWNGATATATKTSGQSVVSKLIDGIYAEDDPENKWSFHVDGIETGSIHATITFPDPIEMFDGYAVASADYAVDLRRGITDWKLQISIDGTTFVDVDHLDYPGDPNNPVTPDYPHNVPMFNSSWLGIPGQVAVVNAPTPAFKLRLNESTTSVVLSGKDISLVAMGQYDVAIAGNGNSLNFIADAKNVLTLSIFSTFTDIPSYRFNFVGNGYIYRGMPYDVIKWDNLAELEAILTKSTIGSQPAGFGNGVLAVDEARKVLTVTWPEQILTWNGTATDLFATNAWTIAGKTTDYAPGNTLRFPPCDVVRTVTIDAPVDATAMIFEAGARYSFSGTGTVTLATPLTISGDVTFNGESLISANVTVAEGGKLTIIPSSTLPTQTYTLNGGTLSLQARTDSGSGTTTVLGHGTIEIAPNSGNAKCPINTTGFTGQINLIDVPEGTGVESRKLTPRGSDLTLGDNTSFHITEGPQLYIDNAITIAKLFVEGTGSGNGEGYGAIRIENGIAFTATTMTLTGDTSIAAGGALNGAVIHTLATAPTLSFGTTSSSAYSPYVYDMHVNATIGTKEKPIIIKGNILTETPKTISFKGKTFAEKVISDGIACNLAFDAGTHAVKIFEAAPTAKPIQILSGATLSLALGKITFAGSMPTFNGDVTLDLDGTTFAKGATVIDWTGLTAPTINFVPPTGVTNTFTSIPTGIAILGVTITGTTDGVLKTFLGDNAPEGARSITITDEVAIQKLNLLGIKPIYTEGEAGVYTVTAPAYTFTIESLDMSVVNAITATYAIKGVGEEVLIPSTSAATGTFSLAYKTSLTDTDWTLCTTTITDGKLSATLTTEMNFFIIQVK